MKFVFYLYRFKKMSIFSLIIMTFGLLMLTSNSPADGSNDNKIKLVKVKTALKKKRDVNDVLLIDNENKILNAIVTKKASTKPTAKSKLTQKPKSKAVTTKKSNVNNKMQYLYDLMETEALLLQNKQEVCHQKFNCDYVSLANPICTNKNRTFSSKCKFNFYNCLFSDENNKKSDKTGFVIACETKCPCSSE